METGIGGGIMLAVAAGLWLVYLLPSWFKRREYLATERNAVRLQQTLRVLAETSEVPTVLRADTTSRGVAAQQRALREKLKMTDAISRSRDAQLTRMEAHRPMITSPARVPRAASRASRLRRTRALLSLVLLAALVIAVVQTVLMLATGVAAGSWAVFGVSSLVVLGALVAHARLTAVTRRLRPAVVRPVRAAAVPRSAPRVQQPAEGWMPVPVPKPLYLSAPPAPPVAPEVDPVERLRAAAAQAERAVRAAHFAPEVTSLPAPSRFATMGIVEAMPTTPTDLDAVLRRRRSAG